MHVTRRTAQRLDQALTKRLNRLTYCFSKKWDNHCAALGLFFCHYNYCRKHRTTMGMTPAMSHGLTDSVWSVKTMLVMVTNT